MSLHVLGDGRLAHREAQLVQLPVYPWRAPERIRGGHLANQGTSCDISVTKRRSPVSLLA